MEAEVWLDNLSADEHAALLELLAISARQLDDGLGIDLSADYVLARGRARRAAQHAAV